MEMGSRTEQAANSTVIVEEPRWRRVIRRPEHFVRRALAVAQVHAEVVLTSDRVIRRLNLRDRRQNKPTNVLTYPPVKPGLSGTILLAFGTVRREGILMNKKFFHHFAHLVVHGALHLRGFDHDRAGAARRMEMIETRLLHRLGIPDPWKRI
jgi:probable rRNA maturation factor